MTMSVYEFIILIVVYGVGIIAIYEAYSSMWKKK
jgi:hypothetical protein